MSRSPIAIGAPKPPARFGQTKPSVPAVTSSSHSPMPVPIAVRISWRRDRPWTCCLRSDLIASLVRAAGLSIEFDVVVAHARGSFEGSS